MDWTRSSQPLLEGVQGGREEAEGGREEVQGGLKEVEGGLREVVHRWFTDTQASLLQQDGNFPAWFQGFAGRRDAEDQLRDRDLGTFLIRLSNKAIGYILSYKGLDRCRHFVISQNQDGLFVIKGDDREHSSLGQLIEHYKTSPIQPFGEYLTFSCHQTDADQLYDVVNHGKSGVSVQAMRALFNQKDLPRDRGTQQQADAPAGLPPALPPRSQMRMLTGTVSAGATSQRLSPLPRRGLPLAFSLNFSSPDTQEDSGGKKRLGGTPDPPPTLHRVSVSTNGSDPLVDLSPPGAAQSEENDDSTHLSSTCSSTPSKTITYQTYSLHDPGPSGSRSELPHMSRSNLLYQSVDSSRPGLAQSNLLYQSVNRSRPGPAQSNLLHQSTDRPRASLDQPVDTTYTEVSHEPAEPPEGTYESLEDVKTRESKNTWCKNNILCLPKCTKK